MDKTISENQKTRKVTVRFSDTEFKKMEEMFRKTTKRKLSEYARAVLLEKPVIIYTRSQSLDDGMAVLKGLMNELNSIGNNLNRAVKKLQSLEHIPEVFSWAKATEKVYEEVKQQQAKITEHMQSIFKEWLQE